MKIFELSSGNIRHFVAAEDREDAYEQGVDADRFPDINYLPFEIHEVDIPGHTITVKSDSEDEKPRRGRQKKTE